MEINKTAKSGEYGTVVRLETTVETPEGTIWLKIDATPPWSDIERKAHHMAHTDACNGIVGYVMDVPQYETGGHVVGCLPYWHHRGRLVREFEDRQRGALIRAAKAVQLAHGGEC